MRKNVERTDEDSRTHPTQVTLSRPPAAEVDAGTDIVVNVRVSCPHGCDLRGRLVHIMAPDGTVITQGDLAERAEDANETGDLAFVSPGEVGEYAWTVVFPRQEAEGLVHEESSLSMVVTTMAHDTSLAVWGVPSPIVIDHPFRVQVGATCSAGCNLTGKEIEIRDEAGASLARGTLGDTPWDGTRALYWTVVDLVAPAVAGATTRSVSFAPAELRLPHGSASARFGFETVGPPQHAVTVKVVQKDAGTPLEDAQVRLGVYFASSDPSGLARVALPEGTYSLDVVKTGYDSHSDVLEVTGDVTVEVEVAVIPPENPDAYWLFDPTKRV